MKVYLVTLELHVYDDVIDPKDWKWHDLLDLDGGENVLVRASFRAAKEDELGHYAKGTAEECEDIMRRLTNGERGCANPEEHVR